MTLETRRPTRTMVDFGEQAALGRPRPPVPPDPAAGHVPRAGRRVAPALHDVPRARG